MNSFIRRYETKSGDPRYYPIIVVNGKQKSLGGFRRRRDAEARLRKAEADYAAGTLDKNPDTLDLTVRDFYTRYIKAKRHELKKSSMIVIESVYKTHILPALGNRKMKDITPYDIQKFISGLDASSATTQKVYRYLRAMFNQAYNWQVIDSVPMKGIIVPRIGHKESEFLPPGDVNRIIAKALPPEKLLFEVLLKSGLRLGEALALRWSDIDLKKKQIIVTRSWSLGGFHEPKTKSSRRAVEIVPSLLKSLKGAQSANDKLLFSYDGKQPLDPSNTRKVFYQLQKDLKLKHATIHSLRHTFASVMINSGASIKALQHALGHHSATVTLDTYSHLMPETLGKSLRKADRLFTEQVKDK